MKKPWITSTIGPDVIQTGVPATFAVGSYKETEDVDLDAVYWKIYVKDNLGWRQLSGDDHYGAMTTFTFTNSNLIGKPIMIEAYGSNPEMSSPPGKIVELQQGPISIEYIELTDINGDSLTEPLKYGQTLLAKVTTFNMEGQTLNLSLWERDTISEEGHDADENQKLWSDTEVVPANGIVKAKILLTPAMAELANNNLLDRDTHKYYLLVENEVTINKFSAQTVEVDNEQVITLPEFNGGDSGPSPSETVSTGTDVPVQGIGTDPPASSGNSVQIVDRSEAIVDAYFAKEEKGPTDEAAGETTHTVRFPTDDKSLETIAKEIKEIVDNRENSNDKYVKLDKLIENLQTLAQAESLPWSPGKNIGVPLFKLGPVMTKVSSAPLDTKLYLVADTQGMDGDVLKVQILEKDGLIQGSPDAELPALKLSVAQMEEDTTTSESEEAEGVQQTQFIATVENNQIAIPIHLRPKKNEELAQWQEKIQKGVKEDETYTYTIENGFSIPDEASKNRFAEIIAKNINQGTKLDRPNQGNNPRLSEGQKVYPEDVKAAFGANTEYGNGASISNIAIYKKSPELLYLKATPQPSDTLDEFFLNEEENSYFVVGNQCPRCKILTIEELNQIFTSADDADIEKLKNAFNEANTKFGLDTCRQKAHFFAQVREEVGTGINISNGEGMNYAAEALPHKFTKFSVTGRLHGPPNDLAYQYGRSSRNNFTANLEMIANIAYANRNGNGDVASGDGWRFRGRGIIQITGREKYVKINNRIDSDFPEFGIDIDANNINNLREGTVASMAYWKEYGCQNEADKGISRTNFDAIVDIVNSATDSRETRWGHLQTMIEIFKVNQCNGEETDNETTNEFGLIQVTQLGNPNIVNYGHEDSYSYTKKDGTQSEIGRHGDDWMKPEKARALSSAVTQLVSEYPNQKLHLNDCSAYNPAKNLGHAANGAHSRGEGFDCKFLTSNGNGTNRISSLTSADKRINERFIELLRATGQFNKFFADRSGGIQGTTHESDHADHLHGQ